MRNSLQCKKSSRIRRLVLLLELQGLVVAQVSVRLEALVVLVEVAEVAQLVLFVAVH
jgi:hypothetical protein